MVAVQDGYIATVRVIKKKKKTSADSSSGGGGGTRIKIDQDDLETVIPAIGRKVAVVAGKHRGSKGALEVGADLPECRSALPCTLRCLPCSYIWLAVPLLI